MLMIGRPNKAWGIAYPASSVTGSLFTSELFTFRPQAEKFIAQTNKVLGRDNGLYPVLVETVATLCSDDVAATYHAEQTEWLAAKRGER